MDNDDMMKLWRQVYVAATAAGKSPDKAEHDADYALKSFISRFDKRARAGKGKG